ncbi:MAG: hypothetical protein GX496_11530, partial [Firmicutes bacterium]|nr:hypothetical protein [Bacillota bacterium]
AFRAAGVRYIIPTPVDFDRASEVLAHFPDQRFSLTDCVSFANMERLGIRTAFSFDAHFTVVRLGPRYSRAITRVP